MFNHSAARRKCRRAILDFRDFSEVDQPDTVSASHRPCAGGRCGDCGVTVYCTPKYTRVGYEPVQPVPFSHAIHAGQLGVDCRYCHSTVEKSWFSNIPAASTCMNCHSQVLKDDPRLALVRESAARTTRRFRGCRCISCRITFISTIRCMSRAVFSCVECHGRVDQMDEVYHAKPLSMSFCLDCHRDPAAHIRPTDKVTDLGWKWSTNLTVAAQMQDTNGKKFVHDWKVESLQSCSACHR